MSRPPWENADGKTLQAAFRKRAGMVGRLLSCVCAYPLKKEPTQSGHHEACPSHSMFLSERRHTLRALLGEPLPSTLRERVEMELDRLDAKENARAQL